MKQHIPACQAHSSHNQCHRCQQIQSLRNHTGNRRHHRNDAFLKCLMIHEISLGKQHRPHRDDDYSHPFDQLVHRPDHLRRFSVTHLLRFCCQPGNIRIIAHLFQSCVTLSGYYKAARHETVTGLLADLIRFSGQKRFIHGHTALKHTGIRTNLVARTKQDDIILHQIHRSNLHLSAFPEYDCMRCMQHVHFIQCFLRPQLLHNTDDRIGNHHRQKCQIPERTGDDKKNGQNKKNQVEISQCIRQNDLLCRLFRGNIRTIRLSCGNPFLYFCLCKPYKRLFFCILSAPHTGTTSFENLFLYTLLHHAPRQCQAEFRIFNIS